VLESPAVILHRLIGHHWRHGADREFYRLQARDAIRWLEGHGTPLGEGVRVLDLGCGQGIFGAELLARGCGVVFADSGEGLAEHLSGAAYRRIDLDREDPTLLGAYDVVVCSNVLEHLARPEAMLEAFPRLLTPGGRLYLSWTNWLSPWGGHDFSPFHYLGPRRGPALWDRWVRRPRLLEPYQNLFPTYIGRTLRMLRRQSGLAVLAVAPRYYTELAWITRIPVVREFATWNCAVLAQKTAGAAAAESSAQSAGVPARRASDPTKSPGS